MTGTEEDGPRYDAFVSYRHVDPDRRWARWLHTALETYRVPSRLVKEKGVAPRLRRVFRDEEEVPASPHLAAEIESALRASRFLIVVCSPRTPESQWVNREIERFREMGRGDRILALLIEGEPKDAFPRALVEIRRTIAGPDGAARETIEDVEPLAADVRATRGESGRFLRRAAKLRLLACLLGCRYDDLVRRDDRRRRARLVAGFGLAALLLAFVVGLLFRHETEKRRIETERRRQVEAALLRARVMGLVNASAEAGRTKPMLGLLLARAAAEASPDRDPRVAQRLRDAIEGSLEAAVFRVEDDGLRGAEFSPKGDRVLTTAVRVARLWRPDGTAEAAFPSSWTLEGAAFSPQGDRVLTWSSDRTADVWSLDGKRLVTIGESSPPVPGGPPGSPGWDATLTRARTFAAFSPRGDRVLTSWDGEEVHLWSAEGKPLAVLQGHDGPVEAAEFSPQGDRVLTASRDGTARLWSVEGKEMVVFRGHEKPVTDAAFSPTDERVLTRSEDGTARLWSLDGKEVAVLRAAESTVSTARFSPKGDRVLTTDWDTARLWSTDGQEVAVLRGHEEGGIVARFSPSGFQVLTAAKDKTARLWSPDGRQTDVLRGHEGAVVTAVFSPAGDRVVTASEDGTVRVWSFEARGTFPERGAWITRAAVSPAGDRIVGASAEQARLWSVRGEELATFEGHSRPVESVAFSPAGDRILTGSYDVTVRLWPVGGGAATTLFAPPDSYVSRMDPDPHAVVKTAVFSPSGDRILCASGRTGAWTLDGTPLSLLPEYEGVTMVVSNRAGDRLLTASSDDTARIWTLDGREVAVFRGHEQGLRSAVFSPKEDAVLTASGDRTARLWSLDGTQRTVFRGHEDAVETAVFSPTGDRVLTASDDATLRVWSLDGKVEATLRGHAAGVHSAVYFPDGQRILSASEDGTARIWYVGWDALLGVAARRIDRALTAEERERYAELLGE